jgi:hypothetical protein
MRPAQLITLLPVLIATSAFAAPSSQPASTTHSSTQPASKICVTGTVTDPAGHPIANAHVYAACYFPFFGSNFSTEEAVVFDALTDAAGQYVIRADGPDYDASGPVLATLPHHPPAWDWIKTNWSNGRSEQPSLLPQKSIPPTVNFVIGAHGGTVTVHITRDGKPLAHAAICLLPSGLLAHQNWRFAGGAHWQAMGATAIPQATSDKLGLATFTDLIPGQYRLIAGDEPDDPSRVEFYPLSNDQPAPDSGIQTAVISSLIVKEGQTLDLTVPLHPTRHPPPIPFKLADVKTKKTLDDNHRPASFI